MRILALMLAAAALSVPAGAVMPSRDDRTDARRFGLDRLSSVSPRLSADETSRPLRDYNRASRRGIGPAALAAGAAAPAGPREAADAFLRDRGPSLGLDWTSLVFENASDGESHKHAMYRQTHRGLPVEFSRVKVHFDGSWGVTGVDSDYDAAIDVSISPSTTEMEARAAALADAGGGSAGRGELVILTDPARRQPARLAWRTRVSQGSARWRYWIDAQTREVALRVNEVRQLGPCGEKGVVQGMVYPLDPATTLSGEAGALVAKPFAHQRVFVGDGTQYADTQLDTDPAGEGFGQGRGFYCSSSIGKVFTQLQGPYVNVATFLGPGAHYDNGGGIWSTLATPVSSPHPYQNSKVHTSTISLAGGIAPGAVKFLPVFTNLDVGSVAGGEFGEGSNIVDNDEVQIVDQFNRVVASYVGSRGAFKGAAVPGTLMRIRMNANDSGSGAGYDVALSSYLVLNNFPFVSGPGNSFAWTTTHTVSGLRSEAQAFYHLNEMRDFLAGVAGTAGAARYLSGSVNAMVHAGPNLVNAQYEPSTDNLFFGDVNAAAPSDAFVEDATVPRHEYTHYFVEKIFSPQNFGQAGAISEALADYFALTSFGANNISSMGRYVKQALGGTGALRELDCPAKIACSLLTNTSWVGEIHDDSLYLGQALWDIRRDRIGLLGAAAGQACVDGLVYQSLLYFPESFQEMLTAMLRVDAASAVAACGGPSAVQSTILAKFTAHGINLPLGSNDPYDGAILGSVNQHNDGFETAVDVTTIPVFGGTIYPPADLDFFSFGSGPGAIKARLELPADSGFYKGYFLTLFDSAHRLVAEAHPPYDGRNTNNGLCKESDCTTTVSFVELNFNAPRGELYYLQVSGGPTFDGGSNSGVSSVSRYSVRLEYPRSAALTGSIVTAQVDRDVISFDVRVTSWAHNQDWRFGRAQLRDHAQAVIPNTLVASGVPATFLSLQTLANANGHITGTVRLEGSFAQRFPSLGTVHLEVFGYNVYGSTASLGMSNPIALTASQSEARAWNNVFNPALGQKTTIKYDLLAPGRLRMKLYTLSGQFISTLYDGEAPAGKGAVDWGGRNFSGSVVASGVYLLRIEGPNVDKTVKVAVVK